MMKDVMEKLKTGHQEYTPATMWFFNDRATKEETTFQLEQFRKQGILEFYIHPTYGMRGDYLDEGYFDHIRHVVKEARRLGLKYWIYDEYNWPSGVAGGYLLKEKPWTRMRNLCALSSVVEPGASLIKPVPFAEKTKLELMGGTAILGKEMLEIHPVIRDGAIVWENDRGETATVIVYLTMLHTGILPNARGAEFTWDQEGYLDTLDEEAVGEFIQYTHEQYKSAVGEYFGTVVKGVFTDEVAAVSYGSPEMKGMLCLPWSRKFEQKFYKMHGYDVRDIVPKLFIDSDDIATARARYDYWLAVRDMYISAYMKQVYDWCNDNNLIFTGHGGGEESLRYQLLSFTDMYEIQKYFHMPGIDEIYTFKFIEYYDFNITPKLASSAAFFLGRKRLLSETYTLSGWEMTLRDMKRIANRIMLLGVNYIQFMGSIYSMNGSGKTGNGPTHNWQNCLFKHYRDFNKYVSSISWLMSNTDSCAQVLMLNPCATARSLAGGPRLSEGGEHLGINNTHPLTTQDMTAQGVVNALMELHVPFEIVFEQVLDDARVENGCIQISGHAYDTLILPATLYVTKQTNNIITEFAAQGGRLILINGIPSVDIDSMERIDIDRLLSFGNVRVIKTDEYDIVDGNKRAKAGAFMQAVRRSLEGMPRAVKTEYADGLISAFRRLGEDLILIYCNDGAGPVTVRGKVHSDRNIYVAAADTGVAKRAEIVRGGGVSAFTFELDAFETAVVLVSDEAPVMPEFSDEKYECIKLNRGMKFRPCAPNIALPQTRIVKDDAALWAAHEARDAKKLCALAEKLGDVDAPQCIKKSFIGKVLGTHGWEAPEGVRMPIDRVVGVYDFTLEDIPEKLELITEQYYQSTWYLNGEILPPGESERIWTCDNVVSDITRTVKRGKNRLICMAVLFEFEMSYNMPFAALRGDFRVYDDVVTLKAGGNEPYYWNGQGYSYYTGDGAYECDFHLGKFKKVFLKLETSDVAEVFVNGRSAGKRLWNPYEFELTEHCAAGDNHLKIVITATMSNMLAQQAPSGIAAAPEIFIC
ncbi:MAG: glycosyl hydrolase [Christensenellales bacterium]|jgi:hypothetical protein